VLIDEPLDCLEHVRLLDDLKMRRVAKWGGEIKGAGPRTKR
jgi:hypothetical protein